MEGREDQKEEDLGEAASIQQQADFIASHFSLDNDDWKEYLTSLEVADFY